MKNFGFWILDFGFKILDYGFGIANCGLRIQKMWQSKILACGLVFILVLTPGCTKPPANNVQIGAVNVVTAMPSISDISLTTTFAGTILPIKEAEISPKIGGTLLQLLVDENDYVTRGQVVASLDPTDEELALSQAQAGLQMAQASLHQAEINYENARIEFERTEKLKASNAIAQQLVDKTTTGYKMASAQVEAAKAHLNQAEVSVSSAKQLLQETKITAPINGIITQKMANQGERIKGMVPLFKVMDISTVKLEIAISQDLITKIKKHQRVKTSVDAYPDKEFIGVIHDVSPTINPQSRTAKVTICLDNPRYLLKPGMFSRVELELEKHPDALCLPHGAVFNRGLENHLYVVEKDRVRLKQVKLGIQDMEKVEIKEGLTPDEQVVIRGVENLQDGVKVKVTTLTGKNKNGTN